MIKQRHFSLRSHRQESLDRPGTRVCLSLPCRGSLNFRLSLYVTGFSPYTGYVCLPLLSVWSSFSFPVSVQSTAFFKGPTAAGSHSSASQIGRHLPTSKESRSPPSCSRFINSLNASVDCRCLTAARYINMLTRPPSTVCSRFISIC